VTPQDIRPTDGEGLSGVFKVYLGCISNCNFFVGDKFHPVIEKINQPPLNDLFYIFESFYLIVLNCDMTLGVLLIWATLHELN